jgi:carboxylesterase type B
VVQEPGVSAAVTAALAAGALTAPGAIAVPASGSSATAGPSGPVVGTDKGAARGVSSNGVDSFLGIPYAAPPVGQLRWRPPQPAPAWSGVRPATHYGNRCPALASTNGSRSDTENCLFINVQRPTGTRNSAGLPVYVFIHGGGLVNGSSNQMNGNQIVRLTNAMVVTFNYRLGVFGFLGLPGLSAAGDGNYGFMDQNAALRWVQRNISAFGGNPARVTVGGESAGGWSVCGHLVSPTSRGLFSQAMIQSGSCYSRPWEQTVAASTSFAQAVGCTNLATAASCLRSAPEAKLLTASTSFQPLLTSGTSIFPQPLAAAVAAGNFARVPLVNGSNRDEGRTFAAGYIGSTRSDYLAWLSTTFGAKAPQVLAHYPWPASSDQFTVAYLIGAIETDSGLLAGIGGCSTLRLDRTFARYTSLWAYEFDARTGPGLRPIPGYVWGAGHAAELAYLFPSFNNGTPIAATFNAVERQLARTMTQYWGSFVFRGNPNVHGLPTWPRFNLAGGIMSLRLDGQSMTISTAQFRAEHQCGFWDSMG